MCHSWTEILFSKQLPFPSVHSESLSIHPHNLSALFFIQFFPCVYISPSGCPYAPGYLHLPFHGANFPPAEHSLKAWRPIMLISEPRYEVAERNSWQKGFHLRFKNGGSDEEKAAPELQGCLSRKNSVGLICAYWNFQFFLVLRDPVCLSPSFSGLSHCFGRGSDFPYLSVATKPWECPMLFHI